MAVPSADNSASSSAPAGPAVAPGKTTNAAVAPDSGDRLVRWVCSCLIEGFKHCACVSHTHADLLACLHERREQDDGPAADEAP